MLTHVDLTLPMPYHDYVQTRSGRRAKRKIFAENEVRLSFSDTRGADLHAPYVLSRTP